MSRLNDVNATLEMISEAARHVHSKADAYYAASTVRQWLDQLEREIDELEDDE